MIVLLSAVIAMPALGAAVGTKALSTAALTATHSGLPSDSSGGTKVASITDPILNMKAYSITIPANWLFEGAVIRGTSCNDGPFPAFRMSTPDGLVGIKQLPRMDWTWSENPKLAVEAGSDLLAVQESDDRCGDDEGDDWDTAGGICERRTHPGLAAMQQKTAA